MKAILVSLLAMVFVLTTSPSQAFPLIQTLPAFQTTAPAVGLTLIADDKKARFLKCWRAKTAANPLRIEETYRADNRICGGPVYEVARDGDKANVARRP
jgi:hypothetical protein